MSLRKFVPSMHMFPSSICPSVPFFPLCKCFSHVYIVPVCILLRVYVPCKCFFYVHVSFMYISHAPLPECLPCACPLHVCILPCICPLRAYVFFMRTSPHMYVAACVCRFLFMCVSLQFYVLSVCMSLRECVPLCVCPLRVYVSSACKSLRVLRM